MQRAHINGAELEYEVRGSGEPVMLIHGGVLADAFVPLLAEPAVADHYRLITYHRRGYGGSSRPNGPVDLAQQANDCKELMHYLGVERAHVVGHSYGGSIALQLALDAPLAVYSLVVMEPAMLDVPSGHEFGEETVIPAFHRYEAGDKRGAIDIFMRGVTQPDYRRVADEVLPAGSFDQAVADADTLFRVELPAIQAWRFTHEEASRITQPALSVTGANSVPTCRDAHILMVDWLPRVDAFTLPNASHMLQVANPRALAEALATFFARHPMEAPQPRPGM